VGVTWLSLTHTPEKLIRSAPAKRLVKAFAGCFLLKAIFIFTIRNKKH
jgi:hypothetical protein